MPVDRVRPRRRADMTEDKDITEGQGGATAPAGTPARALDHVGISVPDIDAAVAWYRDILGLLRADGAGRGLCRRQPFRAGGRRHLRRRLQGHEDRSSGDRRRDRHRALPVSSPTRRRRSISTTGRPASSISAFSIPTSRAWPSGSTRTAGASAARCGSSGPPSPTKSATARIRGAISSRSAPTPTSWPGRTSSRGTRTKRRGRTSVLRDVADDSIEAARYPRHRGRPHERCGGRHARSRHAAPGRSEVHAAAELSVPGPHA